MIRIALVGMLLIAILVGILELEAWKYRECLKVGHSALYCLVDK